MNIKSRITKKNFTDVISKIIVIFLILFYSLSYSQENKELINEILNKKSIYRYRYIDTLYYKNHLKIPDSRKIIDIIIKDINTHVTDHYDSMSLAKLYRISNNEEKSLGLLRTLQEKHRGKTYFYCEILKLIKELSYYDDGNIEEYLELIQESMEYCDVHKYIFFNSYNKLGFQKLAMESYKKTHIDWDSTIYNKGRYYGNIAHFYLKNKQYDSAEINIEISQKYLNKIKNNHPEYNGVEIWKGLNYDKLAQVYYHRNKMTKALYYSSKHEELFNSIFNNNWDKKWNWKLKIIKSLKNNNPQKAKIYIDSFIENYPLKKKWIVDIKSIYFKKTYQIDSAFYFLDLKNEMQKVSLEKQIQKISDISSHCIGLENDFFRSANKSKQIQNKNTIIKKQYRFSMSLIIVLMTLLSALVYYLYNNNKLKKLNTLIKKQKKTIEKNLERNIILLKEVDHRVKNNLQFISSMLNIQSKNSDNKLLNKTLKTSHKRILMLAKIHENLIHFNEDNQNLEDYILFISKSLRQMYADNLEVNIDVKIHAFQPGINMDMKMTFGLILNELITNSFKHAFIDKKENYIRIKISKKEEQIVFHYEDSGKGFDASILEKKPNNNIGLYLIKKLIHQLQSTAEFETENCTKLTFRSPICISKKEPKRYEIDYSKHISLK